MVDVVQLEEPRTVNPVVAGSNPVVHPLEFHGPMNKSPKTIGERSEGMVLAALLRAGKVVLQPFGDNQRYDLVVDEDGRFIRVQCKTARWTGPGALTFDTCSSQSHRGKGKQDYRGQADVFGVYAPDLDEVYIVPVDDVGVTAATLRTENPKNGQTKKVRFASDYLIHSILG